jgi:dTDP-4-dehydrorhamnose 3,5-epimerase
MDNYYVKETDAVMRWDDPDIGIEWPVKSPALMSDRDRAAQSFKQFIERTGGGFV